VEALCLRGRLILVVEDEPLITLALEDSFDRAGASVVSACTLERALHLTDRAGLSAAVLDYALSANNCCAICERLTQRRIPYVLYSGHPDIRQKFPDALVVYKPAPLTDVVAVVYSVLRAT
jgi:DNA-binding response OmpR family regulator